MKIKIITESMEAFAELNDTKIASIIFDSLPFEFESTAHRWGEEVYFEIPLELETEDGKEILEVGDIAYWAQLQHCCHQTALTIYCETHR